MLHNLQRTQSEDKDEYIIDLRVYRRRVASSSYAHLATELGESRRMNFAVSYVYTNRSVLETHLFFTYNIMWNTTQWPWRQ